MNNKFDRTDWTYDEYYNMTDENRYEIIDGKLIRRKGYEVDNKKDGEKVIASKVIKNFKLNLESVFE